MKTTFVLLWVAILVALGIAWADFRQIRVIRTEIAQMRAATRRTQEARRISIARAAADLAALKPFERPKARAEAKLPSFQQVRASNPELQRAYAAAQRAWVSVKYSALITKLNLTPAQASEFKDVMARYGFASSDIPALAREQGVNADDPAGQSLTRQNEVEWVNATKSILGEEGFQALLQFNRTATVRGWVNGIVGGELVGGRTPITPEQGEQLVGAILSSDSSYAAGQSAQPTSIDWALADSKASVLLTQDQFDWYQSADAGNGRAQARFQQTLSSALQMEKAK